MLDIHDITDICGIHDLHDVHDVFDSHCIQHGYDLYEIYDQHDPARIRRQARAAREQGADAILQACCIIMSALSIRYRRCIQYTRRHIRSAISTIQTRYTIYVRYQRYIRWQCLQLSSLARFPFHDSQVFDFLQVDRAPKQGGTYPPE